MLIVWAKITIFDFIAICLHLPTCFILIGLNVVFIPFVYDISHVRKVSRYLSKQRHQRKCSEQYEIIVKVSFPCFPSFNVKLKAVVTELKHVL